MAATRPWSYATYQEVAAVLADTEAAVFVVKGPEAIAYLRELCKRQGLLTDKPVTGPVCNLQRPWEQQA